MCVHIYNFSLCIYIGRIVSSVAIYIAMYRYIIINIYTYYLSIYMYIYINKIFRNSTSA